jgi:NADH-quinone oxidoreductase subunit N
VSFNPADLGWLAPYLILAITGMLLVLAEAFYKGKDRTALVGLTVAGALAAAIASIILYRQVPAGVRLSLLGEMLLADKMAYVLSALFCATTAFTALMSPAHQREHDWQIGEYYGLMLLSTSGMVMLAHAANLVTIFLGIETMSIGVYAMTGMRRRSRRANEAAMKYFLIGAFATGFLMYGMALLYGAAGTTNLLKMQSARAASCWSSRSASRWPRSRSTCGLPTRTRARRRRSPRSWPPPSRPPRSPRCCACSASRSEVRSCPTARSAGRARLS